MTDYTSTGEMLVDRFVSFADRVLFIEPESGRVTTYKEMGIMTWHAMELLGTARLQQGDYIILALRNSPTFVALFFASLIMGVRAILLGPDYSLDDISDLHADLGVHSIFVDQDNPPMFDGTVSSMVAPWYFLSSNEFPVEGVDHDVNLEVAAYPSDELAYMMCSSGSTGKPKRICTSHHNILAELDSMFRAYGLGSDDVHMCILPLYHVSGLYRNMLMPLAQGASIVFCETFDPSMFWVYVERYQVTFVQVVPSILALLLDAADNPEASAVKCLKYVGTASAPMPVDMQERFESRFGIPVVQGYGLTEVTCGLTLNETRYGEQRSGSVGRPLDVNEVAVMGDDGNLLVAGETGEIVARGANIMLGYMGANGAIEDPYIDGWFHTNDLGCMDDEGFIYLTGRKSDIINRGGHKVSPQEVEEAVHRHPGVKDAVVVAASDNTFGEDVVVYVVAVDDERCSGSEILNFVARRLPAWKVPSRVIFTDNIPRSASGKINRKQYSAAMQADEIKSGLNGDVLHSSSMAGDGQLEYTVCKVAAETFNTDIEHVHLSHGPGDIRGWDSMGHLRLMLSIEDATGIKFPPEDLASVQCLDDVVKLVRKICSGNREKATIDGVDGQAISCT